MITIRIVLTEAGGQMLVDLGMITNDPAKVTEKEKAAADGMCAEIQGILNAHGKKICAGPEGN